MELQSEAECTGHVLDRSAFEKVGSPRAWEDREGVG